MNHTSRISLAPGPNPLWADMHHHHGVGEALDTAWEQVFSGEREAARLVIAKMIMLHQYRLDADSGLLAKTVAALAAAHGFGAIERLLRATGRGSVKVGLAAPSGDLDAESPDGARGIADPCVVTPGCVSDPSSALAWSGRLLRHYPPL